jgi:hypothetical protein
LSVEFVKKKKNAWDKVTGSRNPTAGIHTYIGLLSTQYGQKDTLQPAKCRDKGEAPNLNTDDVIMCCVISQGAVIGEYGAMVE